jgi:uncharacterized membrane protein YgaE (UPF0421/DUF939 family)
MSQTSINDAIVFSSKAAVSAVAGVLCASLLHVPGLIWAPVSAVIVTQAKLHPSYQASLTRVAANLIGAFIGAVVGYFMGHTILALAIGVFLTGLACHLTRLVDAIRPAYAAVVIVILSNEPQVWIGSLDRVAGVMIGCVAALAVGLVFDRVSRLFPAGAQGESPNKDIAE